MQVPQGAAIADLGSADQLTDQVRLLTDRSIGLALGRRA